MTNHAQIAAQAYAAELARVGEKERDVLMMLAKGLTHKETADALGIGMSSVGRHLESAKMKTGMTFLELVVAMAKAGWV